eukprot:TRINITY_DN7640_c0_g1_i1.p1 TRINITY_DN7640_c0_g1~~TRINITY_DN7640_c0_g1_i1.p1  ORF type:complete len:273 (-),score=59.17 TRINITY_DN7640_c0_g1_i1:80-898(-)
MNEWIGERREGLSKCHSSVQFELTNQKHTFLRKTERGREGSLLLLQNTIYTMDNIELSQSKENASIETERSEPMEGITTENAENESYSDPISIPTQVDVFSSLPDHIAKQISSFCDLKSLGRLERVSKRFQSLITEETWKSRSVELWKEITSTDTLQTLSWFPELSRVFNWKKITRHLSNPKKEGYSHEFLPTADRMLFGYFVDGQIQSKGEMEPWIISILDRSTIGGFGHGEYCANNGNGYGESWNNDSHARFTGQRENWKMNSTGEHFFD